MQKLDYALSYLDKGISVIPLVPGGKKPLISWEEYQTRLPTKGGVMAWFKDDRVNIGAVCGAVSGGLVALDFESEESFAKFFAREKILSVTLVTKTPHGGVHVWLRETGEVPRRSIRISKNPPLDLLGEGGYGVLPPSAIDHSKCDKSKCKNEGIGNYEIISSTTEIMSMKGIYEFVMRRCKELGWDLSAPKPKIDEILPGVPMGMRNVAAFEYARYLLFKIKLDPVTTLAELKRWNSLNNPPLPEAELETVWKSAQKYPFEKIEKKEPVVLAHINQIETPELSGHPVVVEAVVASTSLAYLAPKAVVGRVETENGTNEVKREIRLEDPINIQLVSVPEEVKYKRLKRYLCLPGEASIREHSYRAVYRVRIRPPVFTLEKRGDKIVDERGFEYKAFDIYVVSDTLVNFQPSALLRITGIPMTHPRTQQITLLAYNVEFPEECHAFDTEKIQVLLEKFRGKSARERLNWILDNFELYSHIIGRQNLAKAALLTFFSPLWVKLNGDAQRGWVNCLLLGDTTTGKSETVRKLIRLLGQGMLITAETASTVGLVGTATQVEKEGWFIDWGFLVLQDRKLLAVDGAHKLSLGNWAALAESERSGVVTIAKAAKNTAYARTRQIKIANPVDRESNKYSTKTLGGFLYQAQAVPTILDKTSIARLDICAFSDQNDVKAEDINKNLQGNYDPTLENLGEVLKWCWSGQAAIEFTPEAVDKIHQKATELYNTFCYDEIPLVTIDEKWKLARLSAAAAILTLSTEDLKKVVVTAEHVNLVSEFIREEYSKAGLNVLAQAIRHETLEPEDAKSIIERIKIKTDSALDEQELRDVLRFIVLKGRVIREDLKIQFDLSENNQIRPLLAALRTEGLITEGRGFYPSPKLIKAYRATEGFNL